MERAQAFLVWLLLLLWAALRKGSAMTKKPFHLGSALALWLLAAVMIPMALANDPIDWQRAGELRRREQQGHPSDDGKIVLISLGMSNTTQEFSAFKTLADADPNKSPKVVIVDGAQGGQAAYQWAYPQAGPNARTPWDVMDQRILAAHVTVPQVQAVWLKQAEIGPSRLGEFSAHAQSLRDDLAIILRQLKTHFPNLGLAYLSSRIYAGYATTQLNPEPYAYESAFAVRWLIEAQIANDPNLNFDPLKGEVKAPLLLWGPYLWADGIQPRQSDGLVWTRADLGPDGTHPSASGRRKVADILLTFFKTDAGAKAWFVKPKP